jgi:hypothetical protein
MAREPLDADTLLLSRLDAEYAACIAASRARPAAEPDAQPATDDDDDGIDAAAEGYAPLSACFSDEEDEEADDGMGYGTLGGGSDADADADDADDSRSGDGDGLAPSGAPKAEMALPASFIESALPTRTAYESSLKLVPEQRALLEHSARECAERSRALSCAAGKSHEDGTGDGRAGEFDQESWVADFSSMPTTVPDESLPPDRVETIRQVMAQLPLAPPAPGWAATVPETAWVHTLLRRERRR